MGSKDPKGGVSHTLLLSSPSHDHASDPHTIHAGSSEEEIPCVSSQGNGGKGSDRDCELSRPRLLQPDISGSKTRKQMETHNRSLGSQLSHTVPNLQDGDPRVYPQVGPKGPMVNLSGSKGRVFSYTHPSREQKVSSVPSPRRRMAIQSVALRSKHRTAGFYQGYGPHSGLRTPPWYKYSPIPGRLANQPFFKGRFSKPYKLDPPTLLTPRLGCKSREIRFNPNSSSHLPGDKVRLSGRLSLPIRQENRKLGSHREGVRGRTVTDRSVMVTSIGAPSVPGETSTLRSVTYPSCPTTAQPNVEPVLRPSINDGAHRLEHDKFDPLVVRFEKSPEGGQHGCHTGELLPVYGQQFHGLGCTSSAPHSLRHVVEFHEGIPHQCAGINGHLAWPTGICGYDSRLQCRNHVRQCFCHSLLAQSRGNPVAPDVRPSTAGLHVGRVKSCNSNTQTSPWSLKRASGSIEQEESNSDNRMESPSDCSGQSVPTLGQTDSRSVCPKVQFQVSNIHVSSPRTGDLESRQSSPVVAGSICLRVSPDHTDKGNFVEANSRQTRSHSDSTSMAASRMVSRSDQNVDRLSIGITSSSEVAKTIVLTHLPQISGTAQPSRLEVISRFHQNRGFSQKVSSRISVSQRQSTVQLYEYKWKVFREWCLSQGIDPNTPTVPNIADFLLHLFEKGLSTTTIKGYRSSLSALMASRGIDISHDTDLASLCRGFSIERPISHRDIPRWDLMVVLRYLMKPPFEPMRLSSIADLTRKTAFLITLATAKRNSEVWAFSSDVRFGPNKMNATLSFLPGFIAKTQKVDRPETALNPVIIPSLSSLVGRDLPDRTLCPVRALCFYLDRTKAGVNQDRFKRLFVSFKPGHKGDLVKVTISGWIKALIKSAYEKVENDDVPHLTHRNFQARELRAMATSLAFHQHHSLRQIMEAASWRADGTFASFYLRELSPALLDPTLGPLVAAHTIVDFTRP